MPNGNMGGGSQNKYQSDGIIHINGDRTKIPIEFSKPNPNPATVDRTNDPACWNSGTPVIFEINGVNAVEVRVSQETVLGEVLLKSYPPGKEPEYHPLIQLYNEILARLIKAGGLDDLKDLNDSAKAVRLWKYLEREYLQNPIGTYP